MIDAPPRPEIAVPQLPERKPSEIVRQWPEEEWCRTEVISGELDTVTRAIKNKRVCALGILADVAGFNWAVSRYPLLFVQRIYGLTFEQANRVVHANDTQGKDAAADYLESIGR